LINDETGCDVFLPLLDSEKRCMVSSCGLLNQSREEQPGCVSQTSRNVGL
jgi:hypothetical protein